LIAILIENNSYYKEIKYIFNYIFKYIYRLDENYFITTYKDFTSNDADIIISYGRERYNYNLGIPHIHIYESDLFGKSYLKEESMPVIPLKKYEGSELKLLINEENIPVIYSGNKKLNKIVEVKNNLIETNIDIIASSFFMLTRYEEIVNPVKDEHDRFPAKASIAFKEKFLERPIVNEYIELLWSWIKKLQPKLERTNIWGDKDFAFFLSHDIDHIYKYSRKKDYLLGLKKSVGDIFKRKNPKEMLLTLKEVFLALKGNDPYFIFEDMIELEERYNINSSWYFMVDSNHILDGLNYSLDDIRFIIDKLSRLHFHLEFNP